jgi:ribosomal protein S18 acetylase RimI-like enzyme
MVVPAPRETHEQRRRDHCAEVGEGHTLQLIGFHRRPNGLQTPIARDMATANVRFTQATREDAARVHGITQAAYAEYRGVLDPPSGVDRETLVEVERALDKGGAVLAWIGDTAVGAVRFQHATDHLAVERLAVIPTARGQGIARALLAYLEDLARQSHLLEMRLGVRLSLSRNVDLYQGLGCQIRSVHPYPEGTDTWALLTKSVDGVPDHTPG